MIGRMIEFDTEGSPTTGYLASPDSELDREHLQSSFCMRGGG